MKALPQQEARELDTTAVPLLCVTSVPRSERAPLSRH